MKVFITSAAILILLSMFMIFQMDNNEYLISQDRYKAVANDTADAAALYYDKESFSNGIKIYDKISGNAVVLEILQSGLNLNDGLNGGISNYLLGIHKYYVYYFDGDGTLTEYNDGILLKSETITYPYTFEESLTGYEVQIVEPTVIVTIDAGKFNFRESFITDPELIRTSGYENLGY